jgi:hypothetical protein
MQCVVAFIRWSDVEKMLKMVRAGILKILLYSFVFIENVLTPGIIRVTTQVPPT